MTRKQKKSLIRLGIALALLIAAFVLSHCLSLEGIWEILAFVPAYLVAGYDVWWKALRNIAHGQVFDENFLMVVASAGALLLGEGEEAAAVMLFYQLGEFFQSYAVGRSRRSIAELMDIRPDTAHLEQTDGSITTVDPADIPVGAVIVIEPGERVPLDGVVLSGHSSLDTSALTGESVPRTVTEGEDVVSGCINQTAVLRVQVTAAFAESTVSRLLELVESASEKKAKAEHFITRFARYYTPCVVGAAVLLAVVPPCFVGWSSWSDWLYRALTFLVISCPCALVISVPLSFFGGIGGASRSGILIKGGNYIEALSRAGTVVFDKTGTLTQGVFHVTAVHPEDYDQAQLLELAAHAEIYSTHPVARSLREAYGLQPDPARIGEVSEIAGQGIRAVIDGKAVCVGNNKLMESVGATWHPCHRVGTTVHVTVDGVYAGHIVISDSCKPDAAAAIRDLKELGISKTVMLTGDSDEVGQDVARLLHLDEVHTALLPDGKVSELERLLREKSPKTTLLFVGDGINDAPVLSRSDVGIAMGGMGSDAAIEAADVVLMDDKPQQVAVAIQIARRTMRIVRQNIVFALAIKAAVLVLGALGFANMWAAVFADVGVSVLAICNAMRALRQPKR